MVCQQPHHLQAASEQEHPDLQKCLTKCRQIAMKLLKSTYVHTHTCTHVRAHMYRDTHTHRLTFGQLMQIVYGSAHCYGDCLSICGTKGLDKTAKHFFTDTIPIHLHTATLSKLSVRQEHRFGRILTNEIPAKVCFINLGILLDVPGTGLLVRIDYPPYQENKRLEELIQSSSI